MLNNNVFKNGIKFKKRKGFTLIEMVIVVSIIGILSGIVALKYSKAQRIARENADYASASVIATASYLSHENGDDKRVYENINELKEQNYLDKIPKAQSVDNGEFKIEYGKDGVKVLLGDKVFYPREDKKVNVADRSDK